MSTGSKVPTGGKGAMGNGSGAGAAATAKRERRKYEHEMTDAEKFALRTVLQAKAACTNIAVAIQEGKTVKADVIKKCLDLAQSSADMLFS